LGPYTISERERHTFFSRDLLKHWLEPVQNNLVHLKLDSTCYWGWIPKCDLRGIHFPRLKSLELGEITFTHDWQLEWIISHGATLAHLSLRQCPIVHDIWLDHTLNAEGYPVHTLGDDLSWDGTTGGMGNWCGNSARWKDYFPRLLSGLPHLRYLKIGDVSSPDLEVDDAVGKSWRSLYCAFWSGNCFGPWASSHPSIGRGYDYLDDCGLEPEPSYPRSKEEDLETLKQLMIAVRRRAGDATRSA
jgi:hypothetical protein